MKEGNHLTKSNWLFGDTLR